MVSALSAALGRTCPRCGKGRLFTGYMTLVDQCAECGLPLAENDTGDGPAIMLMFVLGFTVVPLVMWIGFAYEPPTWVIAVLALVGVLGTTLVLLPPTKAWFIAQNYRHNPWD